MTVTVQWDDDAPLTGQPDTGTLSKTYTATGPGTVTVTDESSGGAAVTLSYTVPLSATTVTAVPVEIDSAGDAAARTTTVSGQGFPASQQGTVAIATGAPGAYGTSVTIASATTNASGAFTGVALTVPVDLDAGDYHVEAVFGSVGDLATALTVVNTELVAPTGLASPSQTAGAVDLSWDAVPAAEAYVVRWSPAGTENWTELEPVTTLSATVAGLAAETAYDFQVKATAAGSTDSPWSDSLTQSTTAQPQLAAPTNPAAGTPTADSIPFSWDAVTDAGSYVVSWRPTGGVFEESSPIDTTSYTVADLDPETEYELRVKAVGDGFTDSDWSSVITATTEPIGDLAAPEGLASPSQTATSIDLTWDAVTDAEEYVAQWAPTGTTDWTQLSPVTAATATIDGLTAETTYDVQVQAIADGWNPSPWSSTFTQATTA